MFVAPAPRTACRRGAGEEMTDPGHELVQECRHPADRRDAYGRSHQAPARAHGSEGLGEGEVTSMRTSRGVDPVGGRGHVVGGQAVPAKIIDELPGFDARSRREPPLHPSGGPGAEPAITVEQEELGPGTTGRPLALRPHAVEGTPKPGAARRGTFVGQFAA